MFHICISAHDCHKELDIGKHLPYGTRYRNCLPLLFLQCLVHVQYTSKYIGKRSSYGTRHRKTFFCHCSFRSVLSIKKCSTISDNGCHCSVRSVLYMSDTISKNTTRCVIALFYFCSGLSMPNIGKHVRHFSLFMQCLVHVPVEQPHQRHRGTGHTLSRCLFRGALPPCGCVQLVDRSRCRLAGLLGAVGRVPGCFARRHYGCHGKRIKNCKINTVRVRETLQRMLR